MDLNKEFDVLDVKIFDVLKTNGFDINDIGTHFYKEVIKKATILLMDSYTDSDIVSLKQQITSPYSFFYCDIIADVEVKKYDYFRGLGVFDKLTIFHKLICNAALKGEIVLGKQRVEDCYMTLAFCTASYVCKFFENYKKEIIGSSSKTLLLNSNRN